MFGIRNQIGKAMTTVTREILYTIKTQLAPRDTLTDNQKLMYACVYLAGAARVLQLSGNSELYGRFVGITERLSKKGYREFAAVCREYDV